MSNAKELINLAVCATTIASNLYFTGLTTNEDRLTKQYYKQEDKEFLLKCNKYDRLIYMSNTILVCLIMLTLAFVDLNKWTVILELCCIVYCIRGLIKLLFNK